MSRSRFAVAMTFAGRLDAVVLRPEGSQRDYVIFFRFATAQQLDA
jgi:hypothetical protein